ncbi:MAG: tetraacyldisaccharide 4'-kinase [Bacteroidota bacterium]
MTDFKAKLRWSFLPFAMIYGLGVSIRNRLFDFKIFKSVSFDIPVICVGNISTGGTGKTPHVEYLVDLLREEFHLATLSRGYKRKSKGFIIADEKSTISDIGDEPRQILHKFPKIKVIVDKDRVHAVKKLMDKYDDLQLIILDDGYQHRKIKPGLSILLIDYNRPITRDYLLPVGDLRERAWRKNRANLIIVSKTPENFRPIDRRIMEKELDIFPYQSLFFTSFENGSPIPLFRKQKPCKKLDKDTRILLITGIAMPGPLVSFLKEKTGHIIHLKFPDHYDFREKDFRNIIDTFSGIRENKYIFTTEKDAMRLLDSKYCHMLENLPVFYIPVRIKFLDEENQRYFNKIVFNYVRTNKRHSRLHI